MIVLEPCDPSGLGFDSCSLAAPILLNKLEFSHMVKKGLYIVHVYGSVLEIE